MNLLILEDDQGLALDWSEVFSRHHWDVRIARNASEAATAISEEIFDFVICDMFIMEDDQIVPDGGVTLLGLLRSPRTKDDPNIWMNNVPILVISGAVENTPGRFSLYHIAKSMGATKIIGKPIAPTLVFQITLEMVEAARS